ncbi:O-methyltransferase [Penicillium riverlandense]|uniref:O-methyltransferase n=1 Tax=Penicillium riverlandense TaxID=1903569 RepID=UPI00254762D3|nr:O-methyltransferase [Penicillium riverlandense]KAJ5808146.1 O-methyltransferase [Penicillium riverlandense]
MSLTNIELRGEVESYVESNLIPIKPSHTHAYDNSTKHGLPMIAVSPVQGQFISMLAKLGGARNILEVGTLGGYSSIWLAEAVHGKGKVTSIEIDEQCRQVAVDNLRFAGVKVPEEVESILGAGLDVLPMLVAEVQEGKRQPFDFVFIDADWDNQWNYFDYGIKLARGKGSVVYVDNVVREMLESGVVGNEARKEDASDLVARVGRDDRVEAVVLQTVGAKSYDGFLMALVK